MAAAGIDQGASGAGISPGGGGGAGGGGSGGGDWAADWQAVRDAGDIQYAPLPPAPPPQTPDWLKRLGEWLETLFAPLGRWLGLSWPVFEKILAGLAVLALLWLGWVLVRRALAARRARPAAPKPEWSPPRAEALALLEEADRLAAAGDHAGAVHVLLKRSVGQIAAARPHWIVPASTAREIAALEPLPQAARAAFKLIAERVERSRFALRALAAEDWQAARAAYAEFALVEIAPARAA